MTPAHAKHLPLLHEAPALLAANARLGAPTAAGAVVPLGREGRRRRSRPKARVLRHPSARPELELRRLRVLAEDDAEGDAALPKRPTTRAGCADVPRPCPFVSCAHHLYLDVNARTGALRLNFPDLEPDELAESCALDVAERGGETLEDVGRMLNLTRERVRQIEQKAVGKTCRATSAMQTPHERADFDVERFVALEDDGT